MWVRSYPLRESRLRKGGEPVPVVRLNETELFYAEVGEGLPCLMMHGGLGFDHTYLHPWLDPLGDVMRLVYYDHRGNGRSGRPPWETLTFQQLCADADALREHLGLRRSPSWAIPSAAPSR